MRGAGLLGVPIDFSNHVPNFNLSIMACGMVWACKYMYLEWQGATGYLSQKSYFSKYVFSKSKKIVHFCNFQYFKKIYRITTDKKFQNSFQNTKRKPEKTIFKTSKNPLKTISTFMGIFCGTLDSLYNFFVFLTVSPFSKFKKNNLSSFFCCFSAGPIKRRGTVEIYCPSLGSHKEAQPIPNKEKKQ